jgi:hypothetical protein
MLTMAAIQTSDEIQLLLAQMEGQEITALQVLGINSLKSMAPTPDSLAGDVVESTTVDDRHFTVVTTAHEITFDLQRTGKLVWLKEAAPYVMSAGSSRPTVRMVLANGQGADLTEPAKTKRITVTISSRS